MMDMNGLTTEAYATDLIRMIEGQATGNPENTLQALVDALGGNLLIHGMPQAPRDLYLWALLVRWTAFQVRR